VQKHKFIGSVIKSSTPGIWYRKTVPLDPSAAAVLAYVDVTVTTLQDVLVMPVAAQLTSEPAPWCPVEHPLEASRMDAIVSVHELSLDHLDSALALDRRKSIKVWDLHPGDVVGPLQYPVRICTWTVAILPALTTDVAELSVTFTPSEATY
jgi:hypothetical protein